MWTNNGVKYYALLPQPEQLAARMLRVIAGRSGCRRRRLVADVVDERGVWKGLASPAFPRRKTRNVPYTHT